MVEERWVRAAVEGVAEEEVLSFARDLVRAPTENPPGDVRPAAGLAARILASLGATVQEVRPPRSRRAVNLVATVGTGSLTLAWNGHLDVVPAGDHERWRPHGPYGAEVEDGRLWGRGSADMKGAVAAALAAVAAVRRAGVPLAGTLRLDLVCDEETLSRRGAKLLLDRGLLGGADGCVVGEPTNLALAVSQRGAAWVRARAVGRAAHGSQPHLGVNAIASMARFVLRLPETLPRLVHPLLGPPTLNVALIRGGHAPNAVPESCQIDLDRRTLPGERRDQVVAALEALAVRLREEDPEGSVRVQVMDWAEPAETPHDAPVLEAARQAVRDVLGREPRAVGMLGVTDARFYTNDAGVPAVLLGPGTLDVAHTDHESVAVADLVAAARIYAALFVRFLGTRRAPQNVPR